MDQVTVSDSLLQFEKEAYFASMRLELNRAALRFGRDSIVDFMSCTIGDFDNNAYIAYDND